MLLGLVLLGCAHATVPVKEPLIVSVESRLNRDACAVRLWSDANAAQRMSNRLLPEEELVDSTSPYRLHMGERRDFVLDAAERTQLEVVGCDGAVLARQELETSRGWCLTVIAPAGLYAQAR